MAESGNRDPWEVVRIAKDLFTMRESLGEVKDADGAPIGSQQGLVEGFRKQNPISIDTPAEQVLFFFFWSLYA